MFNAVEHAARRHRNAARANIEALLVVHDAQRGEHVVIVKKGFSLPHADDVRYASPEVLFDEVDLIDDFTDGEVAGEPFVACSTEDALHRAADLCREAYGEPLP